MKNPYDSYRKTDVLTANRETLLLMMYAGAIRFLKQAMDEAEKKNYAEMSRFILKTQDIVNELRSTLNFEIGGAIAENLEMLYAYVTQRLIQGNLEKKVDLLKEACTVLETLNSAWEQAIESLKRTPKP